MEDEPEGRKDATKVCIPCQAEWLAGGRRSMVEATLARGNQRKETYVAGALIRPGLLNGQTHLDARLAGVAQHA